MKRYDYTISLSHDQNGSNCIARITHFSEAGGQKIDAGLDEVRGDNKEEVLRIALEKVREWIDNQEQE